MSYFHRFLVKQKYNTIVLIFLKLIDRLLSFKTQETSGQNQIYNFLQSNNIVKLVVHFLPLIKPQNINEIILQTKHS